MTGRLPAGASLRSRGKSDDLAETEPGIVDRNGPRLRNLETVLPQQRNGSFRHEVLTS